VVAVTLLALSVFLLGVALVLAVAGDRHMRVAVVVAVVVATAGGALAIAGGIKWRGCFRGATGVDVRAIGRTDSTGAAATEPCPDTTFGLRDPF
jgi:hypothetical protein